MYQCISFLGTNITLSWPTHQQIDCSNTGRIRHSLLHTRLNQMFCNKTLKLCTVYNKYTSRKPWELRLSCTVAGPDLPYVLAAKAGHRTETVALLFFFCFRYSFWELKVNDFPGKEQYYQNWNKKWILVILASLHSISTVCCHCINTVNYFVHPLNCWLILYNLDFNLRPELSYRPALLWVTCVDLSPCYNLTTVGGKPPRAGSRLFVCVFMCVCRLTDF